MAPSSYAELGFIVVAVDARGTTYRSEKFLHAGYGALNRVGLDDHIATIRELAATRPYMDLGRVGIVGHSYGGFVALRALLEFPEFFKVGISSAAMIDTQGMYADYHWSAFHGRPRYSDGSEWRPNATQVAENWRRTLERLGAGASAARQAAAADADFRDLNNDGLPDIWHTAIENETFPLLINDGKGQFRNAGRDSRVANLTRPMSGWSNAIVDLDNDGWKDLVVARSNVLDNIGEISRHFSYAEPNAVFRNLGNGQFEDVSAAAGPDFTRPAAHRGLAFGDLDNDGRMDLVVTALWVLRSVSSAT